MYALGNFKSKMCKIVSEIEEKLQKQQEEVKSRSRTQSERSGDENNKSNEEEKSSQVGIKNTFSAICLPTTQWARKLKKVQTKKLVK